MNGWMDGRMNERTNERMDERTRTNECMIINEQTNERTNQQTDAQTNSSMIFFCVGVMCSGEYDACDVILSEYPHRANLNNMPGYGGNRTTFGILAQCSAN